MGPKEFWRQNQAGRTTPEQVEHIVWCDDCRSKLQPILAQAAETPAPAPEPAPVPALDTPPALPSEPVASVTITEDDVAYIAQNDTPALMPPPANDNQDFADRTLPETAGRSGLELMTGLSMLMGGVVVMFASRRKAEA